MIDRDETRKTEKIILTRIQIKMQYWKEIIKNYFKEHIVKINLVTLALIAIFALITQIAENKASDFTNEILRRQNYSNNLLLNILEKDNRELWFKSYQLATLVSYEPNIVEIKATKEFYPEIEEIRQQFLDKKINAATYFQKIAAVNGKMAADLRAEYNPIIANLNEYIRKGTCWPKIANVAYFVQTVLIILSMYFGLLQLKWKFAN